MRPRWTGRNCGSSSVEDPASQRTDSADERLQSRRHQVALPAIGQPPVTCSGGRRRRLAHRPDEVGRPVAKDSAGPFRIPLRMLDFHEGYPLSAETGGGHSIVIRSRSVRGSRESSLHPLWSGPLGLAAAPWPMPPKSRPKPRQCSRSERRHRWEISTPAKTTIGRRCAAEGGGLGSATRPEEPR